MSFGLKQDGEKLICLNCGATVGKNETKFNFCPGCSSPLNMNAGIKREDLYAKEKLALLYEIKDRITDGESAEKLIDEYIKELEC